MNIKNIFLLATLVVTCSTIQAAQRPRASERLVAAGFVTPAELDLNAVHQVSAPLESQHIAVTAISTGFRVAAIVGIWKIASALYSRRIAR